jgi:hypothetical protein
MNWLIKLLGGNLLGGARDIITSVWGDRAARDSAAHDEQMALYGQFAAEFGHARTWWDSVIDGLNRLPRPFMTFGVIALFVWAVVDPPAFGAAMLELAKVPEMLWWILLTIVAFWFGGKVFAKDVKFKPASVEDIRALNDLASEVHYDREMKERGQPLTNAAIMEWNRRREH